MQLRFSRYVCISQYTADRLTQLAGVALDKIDVVYPPIDYEFWQPGRHAARPLREELGFPPNSRIAIFFGRPGVSKGVDTLLAAAAELAKHAERPVHFVLLLAHEPASGRAAALRVVKQSGLSSHVTILEPAPRAELPSYLLAADCVVIPSLSEGFGYSAVEAATLGCRLVVTAGHVFEEVLGDRADYVPAGDPVRLAAAIRAAAWAAPHGKSPSSPLPPVYDLRRHLRGVRAAYDRVLGR
jgi:glycosyltransferase involved in cell wall biosynthesis